MAPSPPQMCIRDRDQIYLLCLKVNNGDAKKAQFLSQQIVNKIKEMKPLGQIFWDLKVIRELTVYMTAATLNKNRLKQDEFVETILKTLIASFELHLKSPYSVEIFETLAGKTHFHIEYFDKILQRLKDIVPEGLSHLDNHRITIEKWMEEMMPTWKLDAKNRAITSIKKKKETRLKIDDFGSDIKPIFMPIIQSIVNHYNGDIIFYGVARQV